MLFVHPDVGGQGVARLLVGAVLEEARRGALTRVVTHASRTARAAFERLGFVVDRENAENWTRGVRVPNYDMHLDLPAQVS
jgi:putative acetyltransferase